METKHVFCGEKGDEPNLEISSWLKLDFLMKISVEQ